MADDLADLGEVVSDRTLVLNVLRGLNKKFTSIRRHLRRSRPFPSFLEVCDDRTLEEITLSNLATASSTALLAGTVASSQRPPADPTMALGAARGLGVVAMAAPITRPPLAREVAASVEKATTGAAMAPRPPLAAVAPAVKPLQRLPKGHQCSGPPSTTPGLALFRCGLVPGLPQLHRLLLAS